MTMRAPRPPMGWNSWDCFGGSVTEDEVLANAEYLAAHLLPLGFDTVTVDIQWSAPAPGEHAYVAQPLALDAWGRQLPAPNRFPSAAGGAGFGPLAGRVHALGLRFGVHLMRGIPRTAVAADLPILGTGARAGEVADRANVCPWNADMFGLDHAHPGAQAYYDSVFALLAEWGVDFVKLDDVLCPGLQGSDIRACATGIERAGRDIVLSLSPGRELSLAHLDLLRASADLWRASDDLWDDWPAVREQFQRAARWAPHQGPQGWADLDMLPLGRIGIRAHVGTDRLSRLTLEEQRTMVTLWCLARSPLILGGHLPDTPPETLALLTNAAVIGLCRNSQGNREIVRDGDLVVWAAESADGTPVRAVFWLGDEPARRVVHLSDLGVSPGSTARDLWSDARVPAAAGTLEIDVPPHGVRLLALEPA